MRYVRGISSFLTLFIVGAFALAAPKSTTFQMKIVKPDGQPLEAASVNFQFTTLSPSGTCVLYVEQFNAISMAGSGGLAVLNLGSGTQVFSGTGTAGYTDVFNNTLPLMNCQGSGSFTASSNDRRRIVIQFNDGTAAGWQTLPNIDINSVPYSNFAGDSEKFSGKLPTDFILSSALPGSACTGSQVLTYSGGAFSCVTVAGSGTVTTVSSANSYLSVATGTTTPVLTLNVGTAANTVAAGNDARITGAAQKANNLSDLASAATARTNLGLGTAAVLDVGTAATNIVQLDGAGKIPAAVLPAGTLTGDVTGTSAATVVSTVGTKTAAQVAQSVVDTLAATNANTASTIVKRDASGNIATTSVSATNVSAQNIYLYDNTNTNKILLKAPAAGVTDYTFTLPPVIGTANQILGYDAAGAVLENKSITAGAGVTVTHSAGGIQIAATGSGGTVSSVTSANTDIAVATTTTTPVLTLNSGTGNNQIVKLDGSAKLPAVDGSALTNLDPTHLSAAVAVNKGGTGATTANAGLNNLLPTQTTNAGKVLQTDGTNTSWVSGNAGTVTGVTSANSYLTVATGTTTPVLTAVVGTAANTLAAGDDSRIVNAIQQSAYNGDIANVLDSNCGAGSTAKWNVATDMWTCVAIGSLDASAITTGTIAAARLPASASFWSDAGSGKINYNGGNVGIGTSTPIRPLEVAVASSAVISNFQNTGAGAGAYALVDITQSAGTSAVAALRFHNPNNHWITGIDGANSDAFSIANSNNANFSTGTKFTISTNGNVGVGTAVPGTLLDVRADNSSPVMVVRSGYASASRSPSIVAQNHIDSAAGGYPILLAENARGNISARTAMLSGDILGHFEFAGHNGTTFHTTASVNAVTTEAWSGSAEGTRLEFQTTANGTVASPTTRMTIDQSGNVGVGTTAPTAALHLKASSGALNTAPLKLTAGTNLTSAEAGAIEFDGTNLYFTDSTPTRRTIATTSGGNFTGVSSIANSGGNITFSPASSTGSVLIDSGTASTSSTTGALKVTGGIGATGDIYSGASINSTTTINAGTTVTAVTSVISPQFYGNTTASADVKIDGTSNSTKGNVLLATAGGSVGIGTTAPANPLDVVFNSAVASTPGAMLTNSNSAGKAQFSAKNDSGQTMNMGVFGSAWSGGLANVASLSGSAGVVIMSDGNTVSGGADPITFRTGGYTSGQERVRIDSSGNVGIGTLTPTAKLQVNSGTISLTGTIPAAAKAVDLNYGIPTTVGSVTGFASNPYLTSNTVSSTFYNMALNAPTVTTGSYVDYIGLLLGDSAGTGNNRGLYGAMTAGANKWNMYIAGTAQNYFAGNVGIGAAVPSSPLQVSYTSTASSGANAAVAITPTYNQTSTASGTDLLINRTETAVGSGTQYLADFQVGGVSKAYLDTTGTFVVSNWIKANIFNSTAVTNPMVINNRSATTGVTGVTMSSGTQTNSSGQYVGVAVTPTYNQTSTASATDLLVNRTETAVGSGTQLLADFQVGGASKVSITNTGALQANLLKANVFDNSNGPNFTMTINDRSNTSAVTGVTMSTGTNTQSSGQFVGVAVTPTYNQTSTASATDFLINRTVAAVGSGLQLLQDWQVGGSSKMVVQASGNVGIGTTAPAVKLDIAGTALSRPHIVTSGATVDLSLANTHLLKSVGGSAITLQNIVSGGTYVLIVSDTTSRTYTFTGCSNTYFNPTNGATSNRSSYSIVAIDDGGSMECYVSWMTGFN